jgi:two-component system, LuxR family, sensor histidine kinase DctS
MPANQSAAADSRPAFAVPGAPRRHAQGHRLWALPMALSLLFVMAVIAWLQHTDALDREELRKTMISDALSLEAQLRSRLESETAQLKELAALIASGRLAPPAMAASAQVNAGLRRLWQSVTWLDTDNRLLAHIPPDSERPTVSARGIEEERGLSAHLVQALKDANGRAAGSLVVRYPSAALLRRSVPWWLARKYDVRLIDGLDQEIAAIADPNTSSPGKGAVRDSYRLSFEPAMPDAYLELTLREAPPPWYRTLPLLLIGGFLLLVAVATWMLRWQMRDLARAELAWRTEAAWRAAVEDSVVVGLRARDFDGRLVYVNRTFADMVGYAEQALLGRLPPMPYWPPDQIEETMLRHRRNLAGQAPREGYEARWRHQDGHCIDVMVFETPLVDARGKQIGWMGSILDITHRKLLEERERKQNDTLAHHARLTMLGEIASTLAHELNQPLTAIASYNAGVLNSLRREGYADQLVLGALQRLGEQAAQAGRIVQRIREFLTRRTPQREACDLARVMHDAAALFRRDMQRHGIALNLLSPQPAPLVLADQVLIEQVLINLVRNAIDALAATPPPPDGRRIELALSAAGQRFARVDVTDNGPGLQGRTVQALCAPFYSTKSEGMGMGLAICRSIIEAHEGAFDATEAPAGFAASGARFSVSLPCLQPVGDKAAAELTQ